MNGVEGMPLMKLLALTVAVPASCMPPGQTPVDVTPLPKKRHPFSSSVRSGQSQQDQQRAK